VQTSGDQPRVIVESNETLGFDLAGDLLAFSANNNIGMHDFATEDTVPNLFYGRDPATDGRFIFWDDVWSLQGYHEPSWSVFPAAIPPAGETVEQRYAMAAVAGDTLAWVREWRATPWDEQWTTEIHVARLVDRLPSGYRTAPDPSYPDLVYYPETGHSVYMSVNECWASSGSLATFGYPLTEEYGQNGVPVQYFERQRVETYYDGSMAPCMLQLGRLGAEDAGANGLLSEPAFQPVHESSTPANGRYFPETSHSLSGVFKAFWEGRGLDFSDPGVSERESLALFGYPLSEEFVDPDTGLVTQYFERAVFEYHPQNQDPHTVLLRRLGAEMLAAAGWYM
jgi:hypothetical protein